MRLGLAVDQRIALLAVGDDAVSSSFGSVTVCGVIASRRIAVNRFASSASSNWPSMARPTEVQKAGRR